MTARRVGMEVGVPTQSVELPWATVIAGVPLPFPLESPSTITIWVPEAIAT